MNRTEAVRARREETEVRSLGVPIVQGLRMRGLAFFSCAPLIDSTSGHLVVHPASGCSAGWAMPCSSLSHRQSPAGPASQPPALRKLLTGGWEVKNWRWDREEQKREEREIKSERGDGCCS